MESKDQELNADESVYEMVFKSIPDEMVELEHTKFGTARFHRRGIFTLAVNGNSVREIALLLGVTERTLYNHVAYEMQAGKAFIGPRIKANILRQALKYDKPSEKLLIFAAKNWTNLTEDGMNDLEDNNGTPEWKVKPPVFEHRIGLTDSEREELGEDDDE